MAFSPSNKHNLTTTNFANIVDADDGSFTESLTVSGVPVVTDPGLNVFSGALVTKTDSQSMSNNAYTTITYQSEEYDVGGWFANSGDTFFTVPVGVTRVIVKATVVFSANNSGHRMVNILIDTGSGFEGVGPGLVVDRDTPGGSVSTIVDISSYPIEVNAGDKIAISAFQNSGATLNTTVNNANWFSIEAVEGGVGFVGPAGPTGPGAASFAGAVVRRDTTQSFSAGTTAPLEWETEEYDVGDWYATSGDVFFTVPVGVTRVKLAATVELTHNASGLKQLAVERDTGSGFVALPTAVVDREPVQPDSAGALGDIIHVSTYAIPVNAGDKFQVTFQTSGPSAVNMATTGNWFSIEAVSGGIGFTGATGAQGLQGYTGATGPAGTALAFQKFDTTHSPVALYNFEDDMTDSSGNGLDLVVSAGTERYTSVDGLRAFAFFNTERLTHAAGSALEITGDMTVELLLVGHSYNLDYEVLVEYSENSEASEIYNHLYQLASQPGRQLRWFSEGAGQADYSDTNIYSAIPIGMLTHVTTVRANNEITFYVNGQQTGITGTALGQPTGGTSAFLNIGRSSSNSSGFMGAMASLKIMDSALTATEILAEYNRTLGGRSRA